jgi:hypothetical protein
MIFRVNERPSRDRVGRWSSAEEQSQENVTDHEGRVEKGEHDSLGGRSLGSLTVGFHD